MLTAGSIERFESYSNFRDLKDFNNNIEMFLAIHKSEFTKTEFMLFRRLTKYCAKVAGVSNASIKKVLAGVKLKDFKLGASESTFHRMKRKAIKLGILEVHSVVRKNKSQSSNLWVFKRFDSQAVEAQSAANNTTNDTPLKEDKQVKTASQSEKVVKGMTPLKTRNISFKTTNTINKRIEKLDSSFTSDYVPKVFKDLVACFFDNARTIEEYWKMVKIVGYDYRNKIGNTTLLETAIKAFKQLVSKLKKKYIHNPIAYFTSVLKRKIRNTFLDMIKEETNEKEVIYKFPATLPILF